MANDRQPKEKEAISEPKRKKRKDRVRIILLGLLSLLTLVLGTQLLLFYYSDALFGRLLKEVIYQQSNKVYRLEYDRIQFNIFINELELSQARLTADSTAFANNLATSSSNKMVEVSSPLMRIQGPGILKLYFQKALNINEFIIEDPKITVKTYGGISGNLNAFKNFHQIITQYLDDLLVKELAIQNASIEVINYAKPSSSFYIEGISALLKNLEIEKKGFENDTSFTLEDVQIEVGPNTFAVDSLTQMHIGKLHLSIKDSTLTVEKLSLNQLVNSDLNNNLNAHIDEFKLIGINYYNFYFNDKFEAREALIKDGEVDYVERKAGDPMKLYEMLRPIVSQVLVNNITCNNLAIKYDRLHGKKRKITLPIQWALMEEFQFDSTNYLARKPEIFSKYVAARLKDFSIHSKDSIHKMQAEVLEVSSKRKEVLAFNLKIQSNKSLAYQESVFPNIKTTFDGTIRSVQLFGIDPWQFINKNILVSNALLIEEPKLLVHKVKESTKEIPFSQESIKTALMKQFNSMAITNIEIEDLSLEYKEGKEQKLKVAKGAFYSHDFALSPNKLADEELLFSSHFNADFNNLIYLPKDQTHQITARQLKWITKGGILNSNDLVYKPLPSLNDSVLRTKDELREIVFEKINTKNLDLKNWLYNKELNAEFIDIKGNNQLNLVKQAKPIVQKTNGINSVAIGELFIDSLLLNYQNKDSGLTQWQQNGAVIQICDIKWDTSYSESVIDIYALNIDGKTFNYYNQNANHSIKSKSLLLSTNNKALVLNNIAIAPIKRASTELNFTSTKLSFDSLDIPRLISDHWLDAGLCQIAQPAIRFKTPASENDSARAYKYLSPQHFIEKSLKGISINKLKLTDGNAYLFQVDKKSIATLESLGLNFELNKFFIDSNTTLSDSNFLFCKKGQIITKILRQYSNDSTVLLRAENVKLQPNSQELYAENIRVHNFEKPRSLDYFEVKSKSLKISGLSYRDFLIDRNLSASKVFLQQPMLRIGLKDEGGSKEDLFSKEIPEKLTEKINIYKIDKIAFDEGQLSLLLKENGKLKRENINHWKGHFDQFYVDKNYDALDFLYSKNFKASFYKYSRKLKDSLNTLKIDSFVVNKANKSLQCGGIQLIPRYTKDMYGLIKGSQTDRIEMFNSKAQVHGFDLKELLYLGRLQVDSLVADSTYINAYRDKRDSVVESTIKPMPQEWLREELKFKLNLKEVRLKNWDITYEEKIPDAAQAGIINFNSFNARIIGISNYTANIANGDTIKVNIDTRMMKTGRLTAVLSIPLKTKDEAFYFEGHLNKMDLREVNPMLENLEFLRIADGETNEVRFDGVADKYVAQGNMYFYYSNLKVALMDKETGDTKGFWQRAGSWIANNIVISSKNNKLFFPRTGIIFFERNPDKSIFSYGAKALISGIKSTIGIQRRQQKKDRKNYQEKVK